MKRLYLYAGIAAAIAAAATGAFHFLSDRGDRPVIVEDGVSRRLSADEAGALHDRYGALPGDAGALSPATGISSSIRDNLDTIRQVEKINKMNGKNFR